jgi:hypothetical protein
LLAGSLESKSAPATLILPLTRMWFSLTPWGMCKLTTWVHPALNKDVVFPNTLYNLVLQLINQMMAI